MHWAQAMSSAVGHLMRNQVWGVRGGYTLLDQCVSPSRSAHIVLVLPDLQLATVPDCSPSHFRCKLLRPLSCFSVTHPPLNQHERRYRWPRGRYGRILWHLGGSRGCKRQSRSGRWVISCVAAAVCSSAA